MSKRAKATVEIEYWDCENPFCDKRHTTEDAADKCAAKFKSKHPGKGQRKYLSLSQYYEIYRLIEIQGVPSTKVAQRFELSPTRLRQIAHLFARYVRTESARNVK